MCRSIKTLRPPYADVVTEQDMRAAALQYVRKISGFRAPAAHNAAAFDAAVEEIAAATARLLASLEVHHHHAGQHLRVVNSAARADASSAASIEICQLVSDA